MGGNVCMNVLILVKLGMECEFFGLMLYGGEVDFVCKYLFEGGVWYDNCVCYRGCGILILFVMFSLIIGSRMVVYLRNNFLELINDIFEKFDLLGYDWIYFEGRRNEDEIVKMIFVVEDFNFV